MEVGGGGEWSEGGDVGTGKGIVREGFNVEGILGGVNWMCGI